MLIFTPSILQLILCTTNRIVQFQYECQNFRQPRGTLAYVAKSPLSVHVVVRMNCV